MDLVQNYLSFEPLAFFKETLIQEKDPEKIEKFFNHPLSFGTAGLRGLMKPGLSGINGYTIAQATAALGHYLKKIKPSKSLVVCISYDNRHHSMQFADIAARVLAAQGIHVKLAAHLRPTPWLSFAIKELKADAGIMITASHNPKNYNGFKVYLSNGGQIIPPHDQSIMDLIKQTHTFTLSQSHNTNIELIESLIDHKYLKMLQDKFKRDKQLISIVYSPLCGTGAYIIPEALKAVGYTQITTVKEEMASDPEFAGITTPNPETDIAMQRSLDLLLKTNSDIALVSDPDADRIGLACLHQGAAARFSGHEMACLILDYLIQTTKELSSKIVVSSFVTTPLLQAMCQKHHITHIQTLTGFKYIGDVIDELIQTHTQDRFLLGAEESYGYLIGTHAQDKDAIITSVILAKAANLAKSNKRTLCDQLMSIYQKYGLFVEYTLTLSFPLETTSEDIKQKMAPLFTTPPQEALGEPIQTRINYQIQESCNKEGVKSVINLPKTDALGFYTAHGWILIRPSGTEPKLKIYAGLKGIGSTLEEKQKLLDQLKQLVQEFYKNHLDYHEKN